MRTMLQKMQLKKVPITNRQFEICLASGIRLSFEDKLSLLSFCVVPLL